MKNTVLLFIQICPTFSIDLNGTLGFLRKFHSKSDFLRKYYLLIPEDQLKGPVKNFLQSSKSNDMIIIRFFISIELYVTSTY